EKLAPEYGAKHPARVTVREHHRTHTVLRQPHHVAVEATQVAAVVHHWRRVLGVDHEAHAVRFVLPDVDLSRAAREESLPGDVLRAIGQLPLGQLHGDVPEHVMYVAPCGAGGAVGDDGVVDVHRSDRGLAVDIRRV